MLFCRAALRKNIKMLPGNSLGNGFFQHKRWHSLRTKMNTDAITSIKPMSKKQSSGPSTQLKYQSAHRPIPFATVLPAICYKPTRTSAPSRSYWVTVMSEPPWFIRTLLRARPSIAGWWNICNAAVFRPTEGGLHPDNLVGPVKSKIIKFHAASRVWGTLLEFSDYSRCSSKCFNPFFTNCKYRLRAFGIFRPKRFRT